MWLKTSNLFLTVFLLVMAPLIGGRFLSPSLTLPFAALPDAENTHSFSFIVYGDVQDNYKNGHHALVEEMLREPVDLVFNVGDISPHKGKHYDRDVYPVLEKLAKRTSFFPAVGNHDVDWNDPCSRCSFSKFFRQTYDYLAGQFGNEHLREPKSQKLWYNVVYGKVLFIVLDSNLFIDEGRYRRTHKLAPYKDYLREQLIWVRDLLRDSSQIPQIRARFVFFHHSPFFSDETRPVPIFGWGGHPGHRRMVVNQTLPSNEPEQKLYLLDLFRQYRVTAVFTGHEHYYERWREIIRASGRPIHILNWVVTGLGGVKPRGSPEYEEEKIAELLAKETVYRDYVARVSELDSSWTAELQHAYPTEEKPAARFHNYVLITVNGAEVSFQTKDKSGAVQDEGFFSRRGQGL